MTRKEIFKKISDSGVVAVVRLEDEKNLDNLIASLKSGGVTTIEITMTCPQPLALIRKLSKDKELLVGAGTILNDREAKAAIEAGAEFIVSPIFNLGMIAKVHEYDKVMVPGAFSPTEIFNAHEAGADAVKVFPAGNLGASYFKAIRGPLPFLEITPTGGVDIDNAAEFIKNGANFIGAGSALLKKDLIKEEKWEELTAFIKKFVTVVKTAKEEKKK
jgi:2-dehydro-3-deoxyphosphogluconate aldolase/(4S)-4-hydroxy-2-oxoglutarate aldolase